MIDGMDKFQSSYPVTLAGLASDICVHTDLSSGTAAIECAALGKPVLLIDREGEPFSKLNELPLGKVRFRNWEDTINAIIDFKPGSKNKIGEWGDFIDQMDPFRDGLSAKRIGNYLKWIIEGFDNGLDSDQVMSLAAEKYGNLWGKDKVIQL